MIKPFVLCLFVSFVQVASGAKSEILFEKRKIKIGKQVLTVEIADTDAKKSRGLMFRTKLGATEGMLFIFEDEALRSFWMKNTFIPLSIGFFDQKRALVEFFDMEPVKSEMDMSPPNYPTKKAAKYALEVPKGWFQLHKIKVGDHFEFQ